MHIQKKCRQKLQFGVSGIGFGGFGAGIQWVLERGLLWEIGSVGAQGLVVGRGAGFRV